MPKRCSALPKTHAATADNAVQGMKKGCGHHCLHPSFCILYLCVGEGYHPVLAVNRNGFLMRYAAGKELL